MADAILSDAEASGIYQIRNLVNGKRYIGSAKCFRVRWTKRLGDLRLGKHHSAYLQRSWSTHGADSFVFEIVEVCAQSNLIVREQSWLDRERPEYSVSPTAGNCAGVKHSDATKLKHSLAMNGRKFPEAAAKRTGMKRTSEQRAKFSAAQRLAYDRLTVEEKASRAARIAAVNRARLKGRVRNPEAAAKTAEKLRGRKRPKDVCERVSAALSGRKLSDAHRQKLKESWVGRELSEETKGKLRENAKRRIGIPRPPHVVEALRRAGSNRTAETRAKMSAAMTGRKLSAEAIAKRTETRRANGGFVFSKDHCEKIAIAGKGRVWSDESRAKLSASKKLKFLEAKREQGND